MDLVGRWCFCWAHTLRRNFRTLFFAATHNSPDRLYIYIVRTVSSGFLVLSRSGTYVLCLKMRELKQKATAQGCKYVWVCVYVSDWVRTFVLLIKWPSTQHSFVLDCGCKVSRGNDVMCDYNSTALGIPHDVGCLTKRMSLRYLMRWVLHSSCWTRKGLNGFWLE